MQAGAGLATYTYLGALRVKRNFGGTTVYVYSGTVPIAEYVGGTLTKEYIYAGSQLLASFDASTGATTYQYHDHLSTRVEADANATITRTFGHFPFGEPWYETGAPSKWKFTSYERDSESQLDYAQFRYYSSRLGGFMSGDLLGGDPAAPGSFNRFAYVLGDAVNFVDPLGLVTCLLDGMQTDCDVVRGLVAAGAAGPGPGGSGWKTWSEDTNCWANVQLDQVVCPPDPGTFLYHRIGPQPQGDPGGAGGGAGSQAEQQCLNAWNNSVPGKVVNFFSLYHAATHPKDAFKDWVIYPSAKIALAYFARGVSRAVGRQEFWSVLSTANAPAAEIEAPGAAAIDGAEAAGKQLVVPGILLATSADFQVHLLCKGYMVSVPPVGAR